MRLQTTIWIWAGGEGSGCRGPNCGRPKVGLERVNRAGLPEEVNDRIPSALHKKFDSYRIRDEAGKLIGSVVVEPKGDELKVHWISGPVDVERADFKPMGPGAVRAIAHALKEQYPGTQLVSGNRITGIHHRVGTQHTQVAWE